MFVCFGADRQQPLRSVVLNTDRLKDVNLCKKILNNNNNKTNTRTDTNDAERAQNQ